MTQSADRIWYEAARSWQYFFHRQHWHLISLVILLPITWGFSAPVLGRGSWLGIQDTTLFWLAVGIPIVHQIVVWIVFRLQMGWATFSKLFGRADLFVWGVIFLPLLVLRAIFVFGLAKSTQESLFLPEYISFLLAILLLLPALYTLWSVLKYFGLMRAMVGDHFRIRYRKMPLVDQGIYQYSSNAMYAFAFFLLWAIALIQQSQAALSVALFQHAYIWVHYWCTEKPDMEIIYGHAEHSAEPINNKKIKKMDADNKFS